MKPSDAFSCVGCKSEWFEIVKACKVSAASSSSFFQHPGEMTFHYVLKCCACGDYQELPIQESSGNQATKDEYKSLVETLQRKVDAK